MKYKEQHFFFWCPNNTDCMETIQGNRLSSDRPLGKKGARNCLQRAFNRVSIGEAATLPLTWVVPVFVEIIHQIPDGEQSWEVGRKEPECRNCVQSKQFTLAVGATSLLNTAALALVSPGGQVLENCLRSKAGRVFHCPLAGLFPITPSSAFSPGQSGWVFWSVFVPVAVSGPTANKRTPCRALLFQLVFEPRF